MEFNSAAPEENGQKFLEHTLKSIFFLKKSFAFSFNSLRPSDAYMRW